MNTTQTPAGTVTTVLRSDDFTCPSCVAKIERALGRMAGVARATVHFTAGRVEVEHDPAQTSTADLVSEIRRAGYVARPSLF